MNREHRIQMNRATLEKIANTAKVEPKEPIRIQQFLSSHENKFSQQIGLIKMANKTLFMDDILASRDDKIHRLWETRYILENGKPIQGTCKN